MWLIDENLHTQLHRVLADLGIVAQTVEFAGLSGLDNGALTQEAFKLGFRCILTQDKDFPRDAEKALRDTPGMALVVVLLSQTPARTYLDRFRTRCQQQPIVPIAGQVTDWGGSDVNI